MEYEFPAGLPAFEQLRRFRVVERPEFAPLVLLESTEREGLRFVCAPARLLDAGYRLEMNDEDRAVLGWAAEEAAGRLECLAIVTFPADGAPTANLMAPVLLDPERRRGVQSIQSRAGYSACHPLHGPVREEEQCS
jgi:flagellar assembly factor FliW